VSPPRVLQDLFWNPVSLEIMNLDDVLFAVIIGGIGLCVAHFRGEYIRWREHEAAERRLYLRRVQRPMQDPARHLRTS